MPVPIDTDDAQRLVGEGAQLVDVLPHETYVQEHLPGAISLPLGDIARAPEVLDLRRPVVVYCYDHECDLSPRAAAHLEQLGFAEVYDYVASRTAWLGAGLPGEGLVLDRFRAGAAAHADVPRVGPDATVADVGRVLADWELVVVVDDDGVVLGTVRREVDGPGSLRVTDVMQSAPRTVRPSITVDELAQSMDRNGEATMLVTTFAGVLVGLVRRADLDAVS